VREVRDLTGAPSDARRHTVMTHSGSARHSVQPIALSRSQLLFPSSSAVPAHRTDQARAPLPEGRELMALATHIGCPRVLGETPAMGTRHPCGGCSLFNGLIYARASRDHFGSSMSDCTHNRFRTRKSRWAWLA
jgi:hypothetical protein